MGRQRIVICHVVFRFDFGGLENGLVNLINRLPQDRFRHVIVALTESCEIAERIEVPDVEIFALGKQPGKDLSVYWRLLRVFRRIEPDIVHTRNLGTLDCQIAAWLARVPHRIHSEHGWDAGDPQGLSPRYRRMRRLVDRLVHRYVALSAEIESWLADYIGIDRSRITRICNGVDVARFAARPRVAEAEALCIGTVLRFDPVKNPLGVIDAFVRLVGELPGKSADVRLLMVGDGPLLERAQKRVADRGLADKVTFAGRQLDVAPWLELMDVFVLGSHREGISNTILEAMASGLPVVATATGGNLELVDACRTGDLVAPDDPRAMAAALAALVVDTPRRLAFSAAARQRAERRYSLETMADGYQELYERVTRTSLRT